MRRAPVHRMRLISAKAIAANRPRLKFSLEIAERGEEKEREKGERKERVTGTRQSLPHVASRRVAHNDNGDYKRRYVSFSFWERRVLAQYD